MTGGIERDSDVITGEYIWIDLDGSILSIMTMLMWKKHPNTFE